jgi:hypothetical protein
MPQTAADMPLPARLCADMKFSRNPLTLLPIISHIAWARPGKILTQRNESS